MTDLIELEKIADGMIDGHRLVLLDAIAEITKLRTAVMHVRLYSDHGDQLLAEFLSRSDHSRGSHAPDKSVL